MGWAKTRNKIKKELIRVRDQAASLDDNNGGIEIQHVLNQVSSISKIVVTSETNLVPTNSQDAIAHQPTADPNKNEASTSEGFHLSSHEDERVKVQLSLKIPSNIRTLSLPINYTIVGTNENPNHTIESKPALENSTSNSSLVLSHTDINHISSVAQEINKLENLSNTGIKKDKPCEESSNKPSNRTVVEKSSEVYTTNEESNETHISPTTSAESFAKISTNQPIEYSIIEQTSILSITEPKGDMRREENRHNTFNTWHIPFMNPESMAATGFYYFNRGDEVRCAFCKIEVGSWAKGDDPAVNHKKWAPACPFLRRKPCGNIPLNEISRRSLRRQQGRMSFCQ